MRIQHQPPKALTVSVLEQRSSAERSVILGNDMTAPPGDEFRQFFFVLLELVQAYLAQRCYAWQELRKQPNPLFTLGPPAVIFSRSKRMPDTGVANYNGKIAEAHLHRSRFNGAAINEQRVSRGAHRCHILVHDSALDANVFVLGRLSGQRQ